MGLLLKMKSSHDPHSVLEVLDTEVLEEDVNAAIIAMFSFPFVVYFIAYGAFLYWVLSDDVHETPVLQPTAKLFWGDECRGMEIWRFVEKGF